jgi:hypothetical protein
MVYFYAMERDRDPSTHIEVHQVSENRRIFLTSDIRSDGSLFTDIVAGIKAHPYIKNVRVDNTGPQLGFVVDVTHPEHWNYIDPHCRETIEMAIEAQQFLG